jgi:tight adherence protein B
MKALRNLIQESGLGHLKVWRIATVFVSLDFALGFAVERVTGILALGIAAVFLLSALALESLILISKSRHQTLVDSLPELCEHLAAAISSGSTLENALCDLNRVGPKSLSRSLSIFQELLERGVPTIDALRWLKVELADVNSDQLVELLICSHQNGGFGLSANLHRLGNQIRQEGALVAEINAKQGWVLGTAKLALATPWAVVWLLSRQQSNASTYNSPAGVSVLSAGLAVCLSAYLLISAFGSLPKRKRVFA